MSRTKIVCTIGPASDSPAMLERLITAGMNVARLNFSHGTRERHGEVIAALREIAARLESPVAILQDLAGLKIRIGDLAEESVTLEVGATVTLTTRSVPGSAREVSISYPRLPGDVKPGDTLLLSDGDLELEVTGATETDIACRVVIGGVLSPHKGITLPVRSVAGPGLTDKDRGDLAFGLRHGVDFVALSFVRSAEDVLDARRLVAAHGEPVPLIAKIEKHEALANLDAIIDAVDGVMVARGDLGVETPLERVPRVQKRIIAKANQAGKPVITATHMLRSMVSSPRPTRAEVTDVANAVLDGTDAVMLSEETAVGRYPVRAVRMMRAIAEEAESGFPFDAWLGRFSPASPTEAVARAACTLAEDIGAHAIVACTQSGSTARLVAKHRPRRPILAPTPNETTYRRLALAWGVAPVLSDPVTETDALMAMARAVARSAGGVPPGTRVVITAGVPVGQPGATNLVKADVVE